MRSILQTYIREIPDFPHPGILFKDITPLIEDAAGFHLAITSFETLIEGIEIDKIVGIESRGFVFGAPLADRLGVGFAMARKQNKLPGDRIAASYNLEYGTNTIELHKDSIKKGERVLIIDDVLATGGTANAVCSLIEQLGGSVCAMAFLMELSFLEGRKRLEGHNVLRLIDYDNASIDEE